MRLPRHQFTALLANFWTNFARNWDVLLHGNPAVEAYDGIKLAAGGELGVGVGEEEWGSGEREVLEDTIRRTEGLVDVVASRFGDAPDTIGQKMNASSSTTNADDLANGSGWLGCLQHAGPADGMIFSGSGALSRQSLHGIAAWMEWIYTYGESVYGVRDNPSATRRKRTRRVVHRKVSSPRELSPVPEPDESRQQSPHTPSEHFRNIPPPIVTAAEEALQNATQSATQHDAEPSAKQDSSTKGEGWTNYLTMGYGSKWFGGNSTSKPGKDKEAKPKSITSSRANVTSPTSGKSSVRSALSQDDSHYASSIAPPTVSPARFLVGLQGSLDEPGSETASNDDTGEVDGDRRIMIRTAYVEISQSDTDEDGHYYSDDSHGSVSPGMMPAKLSKWKRLRIAVYIVSHRGISYMT